MTDSYIVRDLSAILGRPSVSWWADLPPWERAEWFVWWRHRQGVKAPGGASRSVGQLRDNVNATAAGRSFWLGG